MKGGPRHNKKWLTKKRFFFVCFFWRIFLPVGPDNRFKVFQRKTYLVSLLTCPVLFVSSFCQTIIICLLLFYYVKQHKSLIGSFGSKPLFAFFCLNPFVLLRKTTKQHKSLGCSQVVRHRNLDPTFKGSNPFSPG